MNFAPSQRTRATLVAAVLAAFAMFYVGMDEATAQTTLTWTGGGNGQWSSPPDWGTAVVPRSIGDWSLTFGGTSQTTTTNDIGTINVSALSFTNNGSAGQNAAFTLSGSSLTLSSATITTTAGGPADFVGNALTFTGSSRVQLGGSASLSLTGNISGSGSVAAVGSGTDAAILYVAGANDYSGNTYVTGARVQNALGSSVANQGDSNNLAFGAGSVIVSGSGTVAVRNSSILANNFTVAGGGAMVSGASQGAIRGSFGVADQTAVLSGTITLSENATLKTASSSGLSGNKMILSGPVNLGASALTLTPGTSGTNSTPIEITGVVAGSGSVVVNGSASSVLLSGANSYTGGTTITSGTLRAGGSTALGAGSVANSAVLDLNGQSLSVGTLSGSTSGLIASSKAGAASLTTNSDVLSNYAGSIADGVGVVSIIKTGTGELDLSGSNSYSGGTTVSAGRIQNVQSNSVTNPGGTNDFAFGTGLVTVSGQGTVAIRNSSTIANNFSIGGLGLRSGVSNLGAMRGSFGVNNQTATVTGTVTLSADARITTAASTSNLSGNSLLFSGPMHLGVNRLTFAPGVSGTNSLPVFVTGVIDGTGGVLVSGSGSAVYLNGASTYTGDTIVSSGTLGGNGSVASAVTVNDGGVIAPGRSANTTGVLGVGSLQLNSGAVAAMEITGTSADLYDQIVASDSVSFGGALSINFNQSGFQNYDVWQLFSGASYGGQFSSVAATGAYGLLTFANVGGGEWKADLGGGQSFSFYEDNSHAIGGRYIAGQLVLVPEPSALVIAGVGVVLIGWRVLGRRRGEVSRT